MAATILLVDDNQVLRRLFRLTLEGAGHTVLEAEDGRSALEILAREEPAMILQDLRLPDMDGAELARRLRSLPHGAGIPIVAVSGMVSREEQAAAITAGFDDFVAKPIEPSRLLDIVAMHLTDMAKRQGAPG